MRGARTAFINTQTRSHSSSTYKARRLCGKGTHLRSHSDLSLSSWLLNFPCETLWFAGQRQLKTEPRKLSPVRYSCVRFRCQLQDVTVFRIRHMGWRKHRLFYLNTLTHGNCGYRVQPAMAHKYLPFLNLLNRLKFFSLNQSAAKSMNTYSFTTGYARLFGQGGGGMASIRVPAPISNG